MRDHPRMRARRIAPWVAAFLTVAGAVFSLTLNALAGSHGDSVPGVAAWFVAIFASTGAGLVLATRRGENPIGWMLLANGLLLTVMAVADSYAAYAVLEHPDALPGGEWAVLWTERGWPTLFYGVIAIAYVFPDGRLPSPRWRWFAAAAAASFAGLMVVSLLSHDRYSKEFQHVSSPLPELPEAVVGIPFTILGLGALAGLVGGALAVRTRMRRSVGVERLQMKWLAYAAVAVPAAVIVCLMEIAIAGSEGPATEISVGLAVTGIPVAVGIAVTRYRLYEIDRLINRTLVYVVLSVALAATFAAVALSLGVAIGSGSTLPTAAATLAVALVFGPLRSRVQMLVDRRFDRARYEGLREVEHFLSELRAGRAAPEETGSVLAHAAADPSLELFFWLPGSDLYVDASGGEARMAPGPRRDLTPVRRGSLVLGAILHDKALSERPDLLESVIDAAGLAIEIARLRAEVARRLAEVEESRARIVTAGYEERRRLERDLHDGAQQRLVSIGLALRAVQSQLPGSDDVVQEALDGTVHQLTEAIEELRELARGVRPACLDDGLAPALRELASRSPLKTEVAATRERFDGRIEAAAYFVASEALTNSAKYAEASLVSVSAARSNGSLVISVRDDGIGGALPGESSGLAGITDRISALGGTVSISSPPGRGTAITAELPCG